MYLEHDGERFAFYYDALMGVGRFKRKADEALTLLETGSDCAAVRRSLNRLRSKTGSRHYPKQAPTFAMVLDSIASEYEFIKEGAADA